MANGGIIGTVNTPTSTTATGVWQQEEQYEAVRDGTWPSRPLFTTKSLRFNRGSSDNLTRSTGTATNNDKATVSFWLKRSSFNSQGIIAEDTNGSNKFAFILNSNQKIELVQETGGSTEFNLITTRLFRDISAWYHIVIAYDSSQGTASNRIKVYVNGVQETAFDTGTYPSSNVDFRFNKNSITQQIGSYENTAYMEGYLSEFVFIDGQQLAPTSFGSTNSDGVWTPIPYSGTYGNNGFNLQFENAAALGTDSSPNGNTFTVNNLTSIDQSTDYPEVNFATWNPLFRRGTITPTFTNGSLTSDFTGGAQQFALTTFGGSSGKWYAEMKWVSSHGNAACVTGILDMAFSGTADPNGAVTNAFSYFASGNKNVSGSSSSYGASYGAGDIIGIAIDCDNSKLYFSKNGVYQNSGNPTSGSTGTGAIPIISGVTYGIYGSEYDGRVADLNTGNAPYAISSGNADGNGYGNFEYAVPSGYYSLNTKNLGEFG